MKKARTLEWGRRMVSPAPDPHAAAGVPAPAALPRLSVPARDAGTPTLRLPRVPVADRFPIAWGTEPVPLHIVRYERHRALEAAR